MFLCQSVEESTEKDRVKYQLYVWRVELDGSGRPVWRSHRKGYWCKGYQRDHALRLVRKHGEKNVPFMQDAGPNRRVTAKQAMRLTGKTLGAAALDYLTEQVADNNDPMFLQNYVEPPKEKPAKPDPEPAPAPTALDLFRVKLAKAEAKVAEWDAAVKHAEAKRAEWQRKARARSRRVKQLEGGAS